MTTAKIYHLANCTTCQAILKTWAPDPSIPQQDIKTEAITPEQLDQMVALAGNHEALFSRRALKYKSMGLNKVQLTEADYRRLILEEYTFLKRPVLILGNTIFIGNAPANVAAAAQALRKP